jgi:hypothetical protein
VNLEHRIGGGLSEFELPHSAIRALTYHEVLAGGGDIAEASLQRIRIEEGGSPRRLEGCHRHALRDLGDIRTGGAGFGLARRCWCMPSLRLLIQIAHQLDPVRTRRGQLYFSLAEPELDVRLCGQRRGWKAAALRHGLCRD